MAYNDLFKTMFGTKIQGKTQFWGDYEYLNNIQLYTQRTLLEEQKKILKREHNKLQKKLEDLNIFLFGHNENKEKLQNDELAEIQAVVEKLVEIFSLQNFNSYTLFFAKKQVNIQLIDNQVKSLEEKVKNIKLKDVITEEQIQSLINTISAISGAKSYDDFKKLYDKYIKERGHLGEILLDNFFKKNPKLAALISGDIRNKNQQLIIDNFAFLLTDLEKSSSINKNNQNILNVSYKIRGQKNKESISINTLQDFLNLIQTPGVYSISISDPLYDYLQQNALLKAQVKMGYSQNILTNAERNKISFRDHFNIKAAQPLKDLEILFEWEKKFIDNTIIKTSPFVALSSLANYWLTKSLHRTQLYKNNIYLTRYGLVTAYMWMEQTNKALFFNPVVNTISDGFTSIARAYQFQSIK